MIIEHPDEYASQIIKIEKTFNQRGLSYLMERLDCDGGS